MSKKSFSPSRPLGDFDPNNFEFGDSPGPEITAVGGKPVTDKQRKKYDRRVDRDIKKVAREKKRAPKKSRRIRKRAERAARFEFNKPRLSAVASGIGAATQSTQGKRYNPEASDAIDKSFDRMIDALTMRRRKQE